MDSHVQHTVSSGIATITLTRPEAGNALNEAVVREIRKGIDSAGPDVSCRAIVLQAEGNDFSRGLDFDAVLEPNFDFVRLAREFVDCMRAITAAPKPVVACVGGNVAGGGLGLVAACDIVIAVPEATFMLPEVIVGMVPALIAPFLLRRINTAAFGALALGSRRISSAEAASIGLVDEIAASGMQVSLEAQRRRLLSSSPAALAVTKRYANDLTNSEFDRRVAEALRVSEEWLSDPDHLEGLRTFAKGRAPRWFKNKRSKAV
jgi:enoyl-CoA hydratase/carnithine racemase